MVLASSGFSSGKHYWEIEFTHGNDLTIGIATSQPKTSHHLFNLWGYSFCPLEPAIRCNPVKALDAQKDEWELASDPYGVRAIVGDILGVS
jgi:hypothetical protein